MSQKGLPASLRNCRMLVSWQFECGGYVQIVVSGPVATDEAMEMAETLLRMKREECAREAAKDADHPTQA